MSVTDKQLKVIREKLHNINNHLQVLILSQSYVKFLDTETKKDVIKSVDAIKNDVRHIQNLLREDEETLIG